MPTTIPYDPSLTLGNIVKLSKLAKIKEIAECQDVINAAEKKMNALISLKRSLDMTYSEMLTLDIDYKSMDEINKKIAAVKDNIKLAVSDYIAVRIDNEAKIAEVRSTPRQNEIDIESPIDYVATQIKDMELSTDSMEMNVQYFSLDENDQKSGTYATTISTSVAHAMRSFGNRHASQAANSAQSQVNSQIEQHDVSGTLVISIVCNHKNAKVLAPLILDADKTVNAWNAMFPDEKINRYKPSIDLFDDMTSISAKSIDPKTYLDKCVNIISGATYGSSFIGMVHILKSQSTVSHQHMESIASSLQESLDIGAWFASGTGNFGVEGSFSNSVKSLLSMQNIQSHCSLITMGIIPTIKSNQIKIAVKEFANFDPAEQMEKLAVLQNATAAEVNSMASAVANAKKGQQMVALQNATISSTLSGLAEIDDGQNSIIDINSMMTAMDDYIAKCVENDSNIGVPINYYLKPIDKLTVIKTLLMKYYPEMFKPELKQGAETQPESGDTPTEE